MLYTTTTRTYLIDGCVLVYFINIKKEMPFSKKYASFINKYMTKTYYKPTSQYQKIKN